MQYTTTPGPKPEHLPFPLKVSRDRVTDENAEVRMLAPEHPVLNFPNKITASDFTGWVQERGLYFLDEAGRDPNDFTFAAQLDCGTSATTRRTALAAGRRFVKAGASHLILGVPAGAGPDGLRSMAREVAEPIRDALA